MSFPISTEPLWSQGGKNVEKEKCKNLRQKTKDASLLAEKPKSTICKTCSGTNQPLLSAQR